LLDYACRGVRQIHFLKGVFKIVYYHDLKIFSRMDGLGGRLHRKPARANYIQGMGGSYLIDERWNADKTCAYWETGIKDWWYDADYLAFIQNLNTLQRQLIKSQEFLEETRDKTVMEYLPNMTKERALECRQQWEKLQQSPKSECVKHKCGAFVLPSSIYTKEDVCSYCDCKYQPFFANPIFVASFQKLAPELMCYLFENSNSINQ
jgi:hypothetical protein